MVVKMMFGSHLYGTATKNSDTDYKGVFMPDFKTILLGKVPKSVHKNTNNDNEKNSSIDIDEEIYSIHYFIKLAYKGETVALDMLHAPKDMLLFTTPLWESLVEERERFYTKNLKAFVGYARRQASKYGIKGSRLNDAERVLDFLKSQDPNVKVCTLWDSLPEGDHIYKYPANEDSNNERMYEVCGRKVNERASVGYFIPVVQKFYSNYGHRAKMAALNQGIDWKAISHALRAAFQVKQILQEGTISFPLQQAPYLTAVKQGQFHYTEEVAPVLENLMDEVEGLSAKSSLPEKVDRNFWDDFLVNAIKEYYVV